MRINSFFKILSRKVNKYDKITSNPFCKDRKMIIIWIEESDKIKSGFDTDNEFDKN